MIIKKKEQVAKNHGYFLDRIELISIDGYILDLFHLVRNPGDISNNRPPVLIQHSILTNVKTFMANGKKSLGFILKTNFKNKKNFLILFNCSFCISG